MGEKEWKLPFDYQKISYYIFLLIFFPSVLFSVYYVQGIAVLNAGEMLRCILRRLQPGVESCHADSICNSSVRE